MIHFREPDQVVDWHLAFFPVGKYRFAWLVPGRFKHVLAFGWSGPCRTWVAYDVTLLGTRLYVFPGDEAGVAALATLVEGATIVRPQKRVEKALFRLRNHLGFWCVPAMKELVGARCGAQVPSQLYRFLLRNGGTVIAGGDAIRDQQRSDVR